MTIDDATLLAGFEEAFDDHVAGCVRDCPCGRIFYNPDHSWTWEDGELEAYAANPRATALEYSVGTLSYEGQHFVLDCDCWKPRALKIAKFLYAHDEAIAAFLSGIKRTLTEAAAQSPVVTS